MLKIKIIVVGHTRAPFLKDGEAYYLNMLGKYCRIEWIAVKGAAVKKARSAVEILAAEGRSIGKQLPTRDYIIGLDRKGKLYSSRGLAKKIQGLTQTHSGVCFLTGGPLGLSEEILNQADELFSLSRLTLTHEMTRLVLLEQIYRAFTLIRGEGYHK